MSLIPPPASRGELLVHGAVWQLVHLERRFEPYFRPLLNWLLREPAAALVQWVMNLRRADEGYKLAEERALPGEKESLDSIIAVMGAYMRENYRPGEYERAGNTKTHGVVRGEFIVRDDVPKHMRQGIFARPHTYKAWVRFSGPGPNLPPDIDDIGFASCSIKLMGVPGPKLMAEPGSKETSTQDFIAVSTPTFVTPDINANAKFQVQILRGTPAFYFVTTGFSHFLDMLMQGLWNETQTSPLEARYWSCVPYLLGDGQAMMYSIRPKSKKRSWIPGIPFWTSPNYMREALAKGLSEGDVELDFMIQVQTDPHRMPIEDAGVRWPERLSPFVPAATLRLPQQEFDWPAQIALARTLSYNPWHCLAEHRPLGNQSRARRRMYLELSQLRQKMNDTPHQEPR
ncbi:MAG TPA: catalase family protein [Xanthobacteraceae bacterium]|nr:catalase family protein [Xanthobacteraceae bacterium]